MALRAGTIKYKIIERILSLIVDVCCFLKINSLPFISKVSQKTFSFLWRVAPLRPVLNFSPLRKFIDLCQIQLPLGGMSSTCISVVIPCHPKDSALLSVVIEGLELNCLNPISEVIVVSPEPLEISQNSKLKLRFITDRNVVSSELIEMIKSYFPTSQFGWVLQQLLKIQTALNIATNQNTLVIDSDTVITKPTLFVDGDRQILNITREYHRQYIKQYQDFSESEFDLGLSFVTHYQLWQRDILEKTWGADRLIHWLKCADKSAQSSMSEYQTYGSNLVQNFSERFEYSQWGNAELSRSKIRELSYLSITSAFPEALSISIHSYS